MALECQLCDTAPFYDIEIVLWIMIEKNYLDLPPIVSVNDTGTHRYAILQSQPTSRRDTGVSAGRYGNLEAGTNNSSAARRNSNGFKSCEVISLRPFRAPYGVDGFGI